MIKILFVCHGNICRSPMAEFVLKDMVKKTDYAQEKQFHIESAATSGEETGNDIYPPAQEKMREKEVPFEKRKARRMIIADYDKYDYLIGMDEANIRNMKQICGGDRAHKIYRLPEFAGLDKEIADPWYTGDFEATYRDILLGLKAFMKFLDSGGRKIISVQTMRDSDAYTIANITPSKELMYRAGKSIFGKLWRKSPVAIVAGKGNNAGDGYVVAKLLADSGIDCRIFLIDENRFSEDGSYYFNICKNSGIPYEQFTEKTDLSAFGSILDCLLGTGFDGDVRGITKAAIEEINRCGNLGSFVVAADINSGLNGDTGEGSTFVRSDLTVSIGDYKHGHFLGKAAEAMKDKVNCDIGIKLI